MIKALLLLFSFLKFGKLLTTGGTMLLSVFAYSLIWGWRYAAGFVVLIFVHEMGHYLAAKQRGLNTGVPMFIPFVGAWIELKDQPMNAETEAYIGYAGPLLGTIGALACYFYARYTGERLFFALAYAGFFLNLFNLIPLSPFDGGRITAVLSPRIWFVGVPVLIGLFVWRPSPLLILMALFAAPQLYKAFRHDPSDPEIQRYYGTSLETKITYGFYYLALLAFLAVMCYDLHEMLEHHRSALLLGLPVSVA